MSVLCGWASIDENGKISGGKAGDQTGREVKTGNWYNFKQTEVLRWKDRAFANKYATVIKSLCNNKHVGYDQSQRTSLYNELKRLGWDYTKLTKDVECDCSELVACAVNCVLKKATITSSVYTGNLASVLMSSGYFNKLTGSKYITSYEYMAVGDIINRPYHHVISCLQNGSKYGVKHKNVAEPTLRKGDTGSEVKKLQCNLNAEMNANIKEDGIFGTETRDLLKKFQTKYALLRDGIYGPKSYTKMKAVLN